MFCDLVDSTALAESLDPEDYGEIVKAYQGACERVIATFGGYIAQYLGDGLLVYFGFPRAREAAAVQSVQAGLGILSAIDSLNETLAPGRSPRLAVRIGIHTGRVLIDAVGGQWLAVGETPNVAARLMAIAEPSMVIASEATCRLIRGRFSLESLGPRKIKGISEAMSIHRIVGERSVRDRVGEFDSLSPLVGRDWELSAIVSAWQLCVDGSGQTVVLSGEAGVGKTRLVQALAQHVRGRPHHWLECQGSPDASNSALFPLIEPLRHMFQVEHHDDADTRLRKIGAAIVRLGIDHADAERVFASMLSVPLDDRDEWQRLTSDQQRKRTQEVFWTLLVSLARAKPVVLFVEDLHWVDPSTLELLSRAVERIARERVLIVTAHRPGARPEWSNVQRVKSIPIGRLPPESSLALARTVAKGVELPTAVLDAVVSRADGIPLFIEELVKATVESRAKENAEGVALRQASPSMVPASLHDSLMSRLDGLDVAKEVAQVAAVIGRDFSYELLSAVWLGGEESLRNAIDTLIEAELLHLRGPSPGDDYAFKHVLIQEVAYHSLRNKSRHEVHARIAHALETRFNDVAEARPELVAYHYEAAEMTDSAIWLWKKASDTAARRSAHLEAVQHAKRALTLLDRIPDDDPKMARELELQLALSLPLTATTGFTSDEVARVYGRALELSRKIGSTSQNFYIQLGLWHFLCVRGDLEKARDISAQLLAQASHETSRGANRVLLVEAHRSRANTLYYLGDFKGALEHIRVQEELYDPSARVFYAAKFGQDPGVTAHAYRAFALWMIGQPGLALASASACVDLAETLNDPVNRAYAHIFAAGVHQFRREGDEALRHAEVAVKVAEEHGFTFWLAAALCQLGAAQALCGDPTSAVASLSRGIFLFRKTGARLALPQGYAMLAEAHLWAAQYEAGFAAIAEGLDVVASTGEHAYEPELYRIRGELLVARDPTDVDSSERSLRKACELARQLSARSLELRALIALARLDKRAANRDPIRKELKWVYEAFSEGQKTRDLRDAHALLE